MENSITIYPNNEEDANLYKQLATRLKNRFVENVKSRKGKVSDDPYFDDPENIKAINAGIKDIKAGRVTRIKDTSNIWESIQ